MIFKINLWRLKTIIKNIGILSAILFLVAGFLPMPVLANEHIETKCHESTDEHGAVVEDCVEEKVEAATEAEMSADEHHSEMADKQHEDVNHAEEVIENNH